MAVLYSVAKSRHTKCITNLFMLTVAIGDLNLSRTHPVQAPSLEKINRDYDPHIAVRISANCALNGTDLHYVSILLPSHPKIISTV